MDSKTFYISAPYMVADTTGDTNTRYGIDTTDGSKRKIDV